MVLALENGDCRAIFAPENCGGCAIVLPGITNGCCGAACIKGLGAEGWGAGRDVGWGLGLDGGVEARVTKWGGVFVPGNRCALDACDPAPDPGCAGETAFPISFGVLIGMEGLVAGLAGTVGGLITSVFSW